MLGHSKDETPCPVRRDNVIDLRRLYNCIFYTAMDRLQNVWRTMVLYQWIGCQMRAPSINTPKHTSYINTDTVIHSRFLKVLWDYSRLFRFIEDSWRFYGIPWRFFKLLWHSWRFFEVLEVSLGFLKIMMLLYKWIGRQIRAGSINTPTHQNTYPILILVL